MFSRKILLETLIFKMVKIWKKSYKCMINLRNTAWFDTLVVFRAVRVHHCENAEQMFQRLFLYTFRFTTMLIWGYLEGILCTQHCPKLLALLTNTCSSQNTHTKTSIRHFPIIYEAVTDPFMLDTNQRHPPLLFSRPRTPINSRYTNICKCQEGVTFRVKILATF